MRQILSALAFMALLGASSALAQPESPPEQEAIPVCTVYSLTRGCVDQNVNFRAYVRDAANASDCTVGGGTTLNGCRFNGIAWVNESDMDGGAGSSSVEVNGTVVASPDFVDSDASVEFVTCTALNTPHPDCPGAGIIAVVPGVSAPDLLTQGAGEVNFDYDTTYNLYFEDADQDGVKDATEQYAKSLNTVYVYPNMTRAQIEATILGNCTTSSNTSTCGKVVFVGRPGDTQFTWTKPIRLCPDVNADGVPDCAPSAGPGIMRGLQVSCQMGAGRARFVWPDAATGLGTGGDPEGDIFGPSGRTFFYASGLHSAKIDFSGCEFDMDGGVAGTNPAVHAIYFGGANGSCSGGDQVGQVCSVGSDCPGVGGGTCTTANTRTNLYNKVNLGFVYAGTGHAALLGSYPTATSCTAAADCTSAHSSSYFCFDDVDTGYERGGTGRCHQNSQAEGHTFHANAIRHNADRTGGMLSVQNDQTQNTLVTDSQITRLGDNASAFRLSRGYLTIMNAGLAATGSLGNPVWAVRTEPWLGQSNSQCRSLDIKTMYAEGTFTNGVQVTKAAELCTTTIDHLTVTRTAGGNDTEDLVPLSYDGNGSVSWNTILARAVTGEDPDIVVSIENNQGSGTTLEIAPGITNLEGGTGAKTISIEAPGSDPADGDTRIVGGAEIDLRDYGTLAAALAQCAQVATESFEGRCVISLPPGTTNFSDTVVGSLTTADDVPNSGITIRGYGAGNIQTSGSITPRCASTLNYTGSGGANSVGIDLRGTRHVTLEGFCIDGNGTLETGVRLAADNAVSGVVSRGNVVRDIAAGDVTGTAVLLTGIGGDTSDDVAGNLIERLFVYSTGTFEPQYCVRQVGGSALVDNVVRQLWCPSVSVDGVLNNAGGLTVEDSYFGDAAGASIRFVGDGRAMHVSRNSIENDEGHGIVSEFGTSAGSPVATIVGNMIALGANSKDYVDWNHKGTLLLAANLAGNRGGTQSTRGWRITPAEASLALTEGENTVLSGTILERGYANLRSTKRADPVRGFVFHEDFGLCRPNAASGWSHHDNNWTLENVSGGTTAANGAGNTSNCTVETGTGTTGSIALTRSKNVHYPVAGDYFEARVRLNNLSDVTDEYDFGVGQTDDFDLTPTDAIMVFYDRNTSTNWQGMVCAAATCSTVDLGVAAATGAHVILGYEHQPGGVQFMVNRAPAGALQTANVPTAGTGLMAWITKSAGTSNRFVFLDYINLSRDVR